MRLLAFLTLASLLLAGCAEPAAEPGAGSTPTSSTPAPPAPTSASPQGPEWAFTVIDGSTYSRDEPAGNASVLFFMATWCSSCRSKAPMLASLSQEFAGRDVRFFSLDFDPSESKADLERWQQTYGHDWPHGIDEGLRLQRTFKVTSQSSVVVLDGAGNVVKNFGYGQASEAPLRAAIDEALAARPAPATATGWSFTANDGKTYSASDPAAPATLVFFMASWCPSCAQKAPIVAGAVDEFAPRGLRALSLSFDPSEKPEDLAAWQARHSHDWPHGVDEGLRVARALGVRSESSVVVLDAAGTPVAHFDHGSFNAADLRAAIETVLPA